jgi:hypothetical protein
MKHFDAAGTAVEPCSFPEPVIGVQPLKGRLILKNLWHRESHAPMRKVILLANRKAGGPQSF